MWMRAVANACGYTPQTAKPLGLAYALARRYPKRYERERVGDASLQFAGLDFLEPTDGQVCALGESFRTADYDRKVIGAYPSEMAHHTLFYTAIDRAELFPMIKLDQTDMAWSRFDAAIGGRRTLSLGLAHEAIGGLHP